jgi:DNA-binding transcriptional regulator GbsR (MarR family)
MDTAEQIRRDFALGWGAIGAAWGIAPSTAAVQGYLLARGEPLTEAELREALGLSHRAVFTALVECENWGLIEAGTPRRTGQRGPAGRAWMAVGDHWEWFRRVAKARKERETDPVLPLLDGCVQRAQALGAADLVTRMQSLLSFVHQFDRGVTAVTKSDSTALAHLFAVLGRLDDTTIERLLAALAAVPEEELARSARVLAGMRPTLLRRFIGLAAQPGLARLLGGVH